MFSIIRSVEKKNWVKDFFTLADIDWNRFFGFFSKERSTLIFEEFFSNLVFPKTDG